MPRSTLRMPVGNLQDHLPQRSVKARRQTNLHAPSKARFARLTRPLELFSASRKSLPDFPLSATSFLPARFLRAGSKPRACASLSTSASSSGSAAFEITFAFLSLGGDVTFDRATRFVGVPM